MMAYRLAAEAAERIAAIAPVAGAMQLAAFAPARPVPVLHVHSVDDPRALYAGGLGPPFPFTRVRVEHQRRRARARALGGPRGLRGRAERRRAAPRARRPAGRGPHGDAARLCTVHERRRRPALEAHRRRARLAGRAPRPPGAPDGPRDPRDRRGRGGLALRARLLPPGRPASLRAPPGAGDRQVGARSRRDHSAINSRAASADSERTRARTTSGGIRMAAATSKERVHTYLLLKGAGPAERVIVWDTQDVSVGRSPENDISIDDAALSRRHAEFYRADGGLRGQGPRHLERHHRERRDDPHARAPEQGRGALRRDRDHVRAGREESGRDRQARRVRLAAQELRRRRRTGQGRRVHDAGPRADARRRTATRTISWSAR